MVVRIHNTGKWSQLEAGKIFKLTGMQRRRVRLEVNCEMPTRFDVVEDDDRVTFLAVVQGQEALEFSAGPNAHVAALSEGEVWFFTNDGDQVAIERPEAVSFTTIAGRRTRNPEMERMMFKMEQNMTRRMTALALELAEMAAAAPHDPETGEVSDGQVSVGATGGDQGTPAGAPASVAELSPAGEVASAQPVAAVPPGPAATA